MSLQAIFPTPSRTHLPENLQKKPAKIHKKIFHVLDDHTTDVEMIGDAAKIIRDSYGTANHIKGKQINPSIVNHMSALADSFEFLEIFGNIKSLVHLSRKKPLTSYKKMMYALKTTSAVFSLAYGVMSGFKLVNELILDKVGKGALSYGKIPVFGLPFLTLFSLFDLVRTSIDAVISGFKLRKYSRHLSHTAKKIEGWKKPIDVSFAEVKINRLKEKQAFLIKDGTTLCKAIESSKKPNKWLNIHATLKNHFISRAEKLKKWETIHKKLNEGSLSSKELKEFQSLKHQKWKIKQVNLKWRIGKEILSLILSCLTAVFLFATIVLGFTGIGALPAFLLASSIIGLSLSVGYFTKHLLIKYKNDTEYKKVEIPIPKEFQNLGI